MSYRVKLIADSLNTVNGARLSTFELTYPRFIHAEIMTHREFSRNAASSRAIPTEKILKAVNSDPAGPVSWGKNKKGMSADVDLDFASMVEAEDTWYTARFAVMAAVRRLHDIGVHKQLANRLLEPWMFITTIVSATQFNNFFHQRLAPDAQPELQWVATQMKERLDESEPERLLPGQWHLPYISEAELTDYPLYDCKKVSTARCARVSYLNHGAGREWNLDKALHDRLVENGHWSPLEHVACAVEGFHSSGNFKGWFQYRKEYSREYVA